MAHPPTDPLLLFLGDAVLLDALSPESHVELLVGQYAIECFLHERRHPVVDLFK